MAGAVGIRVGGFERTFRDEEARTLIATKANASDVYTKAETDAKLGEKAGLESTNAALALKADKSDTYTLGLGTEIPAGADLNDYTTPGVYTCHTNAIAATLSNAPVSIAFTLIVKTPFNSGGYVIQEVTPYKIENNASASHWSRSKNLGGTYGAWVCDGGIDSIVAEGTSDKWTWIKYANGNYICWMLSDLMSVNVSTQYVTGWYDNTVEFSLPFTVKTVKASHIAYQSTGKLLFGQCHSATTTAVRFFISTPGAALTGTSVYCRVFVTGTWK